MLHTLAQESKTKEGKSRRTVPSIRRHIGVVHPRVDLHGVEDRRKGGVAQCLEGDVVPMGCLDGLTAIHVV